MAYCLMSMESVHFDGNFLPVSFVECMRPLLSRLYLHSHQVFQDDLCLSFQLSLGSENCLMSYLTSLGFVDETKV